MSIWIGTSNVVVPGNKTAFPEPFRSKSRLHYYASIFNSVEINSSFYKTPLLKTYEKWAADVPDYFRFSIKLSKDVTHSKELKGGLSHIDKFMQAAKGIGMKKGCLLIQFPGRITLDHYDRVERILHQVSLQDENNEWKKAVEFRHKSWYTGETSEMLDEYSASMVLQDIPESRMTTFGGKADFVYMRFHGPKGDYRDSYPDIFLKEKAAGMISWTKQGKQVYAYFNNTIGSAYANAIRLQQLVLKKSNLKP